MKRILFNFEIALFALLSNKLRAALTALGIIFGVAAVIAMLAIITGANQEIQEQIKLVGANNIVVKPIVEQKEEEVTEGGSEGESDRSVSMGLSMRDVQSIQQVIPHIQRISPEIVMETHIVKNGYRRSAKLVGVNPDYFGLYHFELEEGNMFSSYQLKHGSQVCIIGRGIKSKFFSKENPIGKFIKCDSRWLKVIGVLKKRDASSSSISKLGIRNVNMDVYTPIQTFLIRYKNRSLVTHAMMQDALHRDDDESQSPVNYHQIDKLVIQFEESSQVLAAQELLSRMLERRHYGVVDYEIEAPEVILKQEQKTKKMMNSVLTAIALISLLVGGIGIMNIMLASVMERIKEIGLRKSLGAKGQDIIQQFLLEAVLISFSGGVVGVCLGVGTSYLIGSWMEMTVIITPFSILISFVVAASVGLISGIYPARKAAKQDPIQSLRYE